MQVLVEVGSISEQSLTHCLKDRARLKTTEILASLNGTLSRPQGQLLKMQLSHLVDLQENLQEVEAKIRNSFIDFAGSIELLGSIPGIAETAAFAISAEIGQNTSAFPTAQHICS